MGGYDIGAFLVANIAVMVLKQRGWNRTADEGLLVAIALLAGVIDLLLQGKLQVGAELYATMGLIYTSARLNYEFILRHVPVAKIVGGWNAWGTLSAIMGAVARVRLPLKPKP